MIEIVLVAVILILLLNNLATQRQFLNHLKQLENKLAKIEPEGEFDSPNEIKENTYKDLDEVNPSIINNQ